MISSGLVVPPRHNVAGIMVSAATYDTTTQPTIEAARSGRSLLVGPTSVHTLTLGVLDRAFGAQLNSFDLLPPDGQPVRWALNSLHDARLADRVYGPTLMLRLCEAAANEALSVYLYGGRPDVLDRLVGNLRDRLPALKVAGFHSPPFRPLTPEEDARAVQAILASGAGLVFVGLGCPRQERWATAHRERLSMPIICVGAAFDFHAGTLRQAPAWMQSRGLEWLFRLLMEPRRLWRRYAYHIPIFIGLVARDYLAARLRRRSAARAAPR